MFYVYELFRKTYFEIGISTIYTIDSIYIIVVFVEHKKS